MTEIKSLESLLYPITTKDFINDYFEKKVLHIKLDNNRTSNYYHSLLNRDTLDAFLNEQSVKFPDVQLVGTPDGFKHSSYLYGDNRVNVSKLYKYYHEGATINVVGLNRFLLNLGKLCNNLTKETSHVYQTNIYCTPSNTQGFKTHYDSHDVIVLQVHGNKEWEIYDSPIELPLKSSQSFTPEMDLNPTLKQTLTLKEGEMLYIPRGVMHNAKATDTSSIHITLGLLGTTIHELLSNYVNTFALNNKELRKFLPLGYINNSSIKNKLKDDLKNLMMNYFEDETFNNVIDAMEDEIIRKVPTKVLGQLKDIDRLNENGINFNEVIYSIRDNLILKTQIIDEEFVIKVNGSEHTFPDYVESTFNIIKAKETFSLKDLGNDLDDEGKEVLIEFLLKESVITII